jgi:hypothetical protein
MEVIEQGVPHSLEVDPARTIGLSVEDDADLEYDGEGEGQEEEIIDEHDVPLRINIDPPNPNLRKSLPSYVNDAWQDVRKKYFGLGRLDNRPILYSEYHTYWTPRSSPLMKVHCNKSFPEPAAYYDPLFFLWDPLDLEDILCPNGCKSGDGSRCQLVRNGIRDRPRRVVGLSECYWLGGRRYLCRGCNKTFNSWDARILESLPLHISAEFPAFLTHRSAIDKKLLSFMSLCFSSGMGGKQSSDALRAQHREQFDLLHCQYLDAVVYKTDHRFSACTQAKPFRTFDGAYAGFAPSAKWLSNIWDNMMEVQTPHVEQYMSLLDADILGMNFSHKVRSSLNSNFVEFK